MGEDGALSDRRRAASLFRFVLVVIFAGLTAGVTVGLFRLDPFGVVVDRDGTARLMDFASHRAFACAAWSGDSIRGSARSIYTVEAHLRATEAWTHRPARVALPFGYSPTMLWVLGPTCLVPAAEGYVAWVAVSLVAIIAIVVRAGLPWTVMLPFATPLAIYTLAHGQTAILSTAGLLWLMTHDRDVDTDGTAWRRGAVLWLMTAKPPVAVTAAIALMARRRWRAVVIAIALSVVSTLLLVPWLGPGWARDYVAMVGQYDRVHLPPAFAWSIVPEWMTNLRAVLLVHLGIRDDVAVAVANALWLAALVGIAVAGWRGHVGSARVWTFAVLAYLLFCPHVSATENLALSCILAAVGVPRTAAALTVVVLIVAGLWLSPVIGPTEGRPITLFFAMIAVFVVFVANPRLGTCEVCA